VAADHQQGVERLGHVRQRPVRDQERAAGGPHQADPRSPDIQPVPAILRQPAVGDGLCGAGPVQSLDAGETSDKEDTMTPFISLAPTTQAALLVDLEGL
jgi:hypothetical protein